MCQPLGSWEVGVDKSQHPEILKGGTFAGGHHHDELRSTPNFPTSSSLARMGKRCRWRRSTWKEQKGWRSDVESLRDLVADVAAIKETWAV
jgi:hypothetical protein